jgi:hypothetical protein
MELLMLFGMAGIFGIGALIYALTDKDSKPAAS